jgi:hypothetical protein
VDCVNRIFAVVASICITAQLYAFFYLQTVLKVKLTNAYLIIYGGDIAGSRCSRSSASLSNRIDRKKLMMAGCLLAVIGCIPVERTR